MAENEGMFTIKRKSVDANKFAFAPQMNSQRDLPGKSTPLIFPSHLLPGGDK